jgi:hypothetical protein
MNKKWGRGEAACALAACVLVPALLLLYLWWDTSGDWGPVLLFGAFYVAVFCPAAWFFFRNAIGRPPQEPDGPVRPVSS